MALHNVDKGNIDRNSPGVNSHDKLQDVIRSSHGTTSIDPKTDLSSSAFSQTQNGRFLVNDGTTNRVIVGALSDGTFGMKVSQTGNNVLTIGNSGLIFNTAFNMFKIVATNTATITNGATSSTRTTIAHSQSFIPIPLVFVNLSSTYYPLPLSSSVTRDTVNNVLKFQDQITASTDATNLYIDWNNSGAQLWGGSLTIRYYLLQETAN